MNNERKVYICLVCHTEPDVWDGGFHSIDLILPKFTQMLQEVHDSTGATPRVAWCLTSQVAEQRPEPFRELLYLGHEIGVHSHFPAASGELEHQQVLNKENLDRFADWMPELCSHITAAGFPRPHTHVTWMFAFRDTMIGILADNDLHVDCSVCFGGAHTLPDGFLLADSRRVTNGKPYRLAESDHCREGTSSVVELPVSGGLGGYWEPDEKGGFKYFTPVGSDSESGKMMKIFKDRLDRLSPSENDIFHIYFHLYDFLPPWGIDMERLNRAEKILKFMAEDNRVRFSTPVEAVSNWIATRTTG